MEDTNPSFCRLDMPAGGAKVNAMVLLSHNGAVSAQRQEVDTWQLLLLCILAAIGANSAGKSRNGFFLVSQRNSRNQFRSKERKYTCNSKDHKCS